MMKRMMVVIAGSVMALSASLAWAGAASNVESANVQTIQQGDNKAKTEVISGQNVEASANASSVTVKSEATGEATSSVKLDNLQTIQMGNNKAETTVIGGSDVKAESNASAVTIESTAKEK